MPVKEKIQRAAVFIIAGWFRWIHKNRHQMVMVLVFAGRPAVWTVRFLLRHVFVYPYRVFLVARRFARAAGVTEFARSPRPLVHVAVVAIVIAVSITNLQARAAVAPSAGEKSVFFALVGDEEELADEELVDEAPARAPRSYWSPDAVEPPLFGDVDDINFEDEAGLNPPTVAGGAVLQPAFPVGAPSVAPRNRTEFYVVQSGDSLERIANRFGVTISTIIWENKLSVRSIIRPGDRLSIPPVSGVLHTVRKGDTIASIAKRYGTTQEKILAWNVSRVLAVGDRIVVPDGAPPAPPAPPRLAPVRSVIAPSPAAAGTGRMVWPTAWRIITQYFKWKHSGVDLDGDYTTPIYAADAGVVTHAGWGRTRGGYGLYIDIDHGNGFVTRYGHASKVFIQAGEPVARGQSIAMVGTTGRSTGTHLHFEVIKNGRRVNPLEYIR